MNIKKSDPFGRAVQDYYRSFIHWRRIKVWSGVTGYEKINPAYLFRNYSQMPFPERKALETCYGKILDIGACAGSHSLYLQQRGYDVTALDLSPGCCEIMHKRGINNVICEDFYSYNTGKFDTLLLLMNGIGIAGSLDKLIIFLKHCESLLNPGGQILFDSSDIDYIYVEKDGSRWIDLNKEYYGEVRYKLFYRDEESEQFDWLFIDPATMKMKANEAGFSFNILAEGIHYDYLGVLKKDGK
jgi:SAM-dependent methyltransferase